jgi:hypothetical protein
VTQSHDFYPLDDGRFIDARGKLIKKPHATAERTPIAVCSPFPVSDGTQKFGFRQANGQWLVQPRFLRAEKFSEGRAAVTLESGPNGASACSYVRLDGSLLKSRFRTCTDFNSGVAFTMDMDGISAIINRDGAPLIENTQAADWGHITAIVSEGLIALYDQISGMVGYANTNGTWVIKPQFAIGGDFHEGLAAVRLTENGLVGFIDTTGKLVIPPKFGSNAGDAPFFAEGLAAVGKDDNWPNSNLDPPGKLGFINRKGQWVIPPKYQTGQNFSGGMAHVYLGEREYYIDRAGRIIWPPAGKTSGTKAKK